jgi:glucose-1-phosphate thymidylyltransferase
MKGVVLAGGTGSRLNPLTRVTNKHLLPVYDKPMVWYPIQTLVNAGIQEILLVTGGKNSGDFLRLLGNGRDFGLKHLNYTWVERFFDAKMCKKCEKPLLMRKNKGQADSAVLTR